MLVAWERKTKRNRNGAAQGCARIASVRGASNLIAARYFICANWLQSTQRIENIRRCRCYAARATSRKSEAHHVAAIGGN